LPLSDSTAPRRPIHTRRVEFNAFQREDGLWDIEGLIVDVKTIDCVLESGVRPAGQPIHEMRVRLTIDEDLNIVAAEACSDAVPYPGHCEAIGPDYRRLVGLNLSRGFRARVADLFGRTRGCTHITEMLSGFPTAAIQSIFRDPPPDAKPFQLDRCHALQSSGEAVRQYYPRWYVGPANSARG